MRNKVIPVASIIVFAMFTLLMYGGSYYFLVESDFSHNKESVNSIQEFTLVAKYKVGGETSKAIYYPAHQIDRVVRPERWDIMQIFSSRGC